MKINFFINWNFPFFKFFVCFIYFYFKITNIRWDGIFFGVPVTIGISGIEIIIELKLTDEEKKAIDTSAQDVKKMIDEVDKLLNKS